MGRITLNESIEKIKEIELIWTSDQANPGPIQAQWIDFRSLNGKSLDKEFC